MGCITRLTLDKDNPPDALTCKYCMCCVGAMTWYKTPPKGRSAHWVRTRRCTKCRSTKANHGFSSHLEYDKYLSSGCYVTGCIRTASCIDHDHSICSRRDHSCEKCRRGPCCAFCNRWLTEGVTVEILRERDRTYRALADQALLIAAHLEVTNREGR
jgi:hypothetical protein